MAAAEEALRDAGWGTLSSCKLTEKEKERTVKKTPLYGG